MKATFVVVLALAVAGGVHAQESAAPAAGVSTAPAAATAMPNESSAVPAAGVAAAAPALALKKICTRERSMGTNMTKRVCRDAEAVRDAGNATRDAVQRSQQVGINAPARQGL
ncbi:hypothetical protein [Lysobacter sp. HA18]